ncbi:MULTISPECIES: substrate-binding domain-containing protein [unclassified Polynucleobacter]|jgi:molybdate transport repressor ModE-like protein|uniref:substrate-binding domain-containing protein n=1 Tax=unclassified Polynucleobacter TaxID=2640945 RepID=UPI001BFED504|nr:MULTISPECIES: substrate-binding domain-containing protein [unclassified Polynucleobacter]MBU3632361.1 helix-turn-helix transcriptional regulator [Polynucleobacter sp. AP-Feld-500C-C5]QWE05878.1 helix-turn-helix transcriptional regulator [Polynucleobacter sp. JS-JIR-5-A7]
MQIEVRPSLVVQSQGKNSVDLIWLSQLLKDIESGSSLVVASKRAGTSYRGAWGKLNEVEATLGMPLIVRTKGHGSKLTEFGSFLFKFIDDMQAGHLKYGNAYQEALMKEMNRVQKSESARWKFLSSSDSIIQQAVREVKGFNLKIAGSGESLERLLNNEADIAGYHVSNEQSSKAIYQRLSKSDIQIYPVMKRTQGLIVKKGNPRHIRSIEDLLNQKIRFINRQIGSGTRLMLDTLLINEGIDPFEINGYLQEEFTHSAVANAILADKADVGIGVKNIALENGLGFVPLQDEIFFIAMHKEMVSQPESSKLIRKIRSYSGNTPGYKAVSLNRQVKDWL